MFSRRVAPRGKFFSESVWGRIWAWVRFRKIFGIWPPHRDQNQGVFQEFVNGELERLARDFHLLCLEERWILEKTSPRRRLTKVRYRLKRAKKVFWRAHDAAEAVGFRVGKSYKDHLPETLRHRGVFDSLDPPSLPAA